MSKRTRRPAARGPWVTGRADDRRGEFWDRAPAGSDLVRSGQLFQKATAKRSACGGTSGRGQGHGGMVKAGRREETPSPDASGRSPPRPADRRQPPATLLLAHRGARGAAARRRRRGKGEHRHPADNGKRRATSSGLPGGKVNTMRGRSCAGGADSSVHA